MKYAVHSLRDQLTRKTRKAAVNTVLLAAFEEIQVNSNEYRGTCTCLHEQQIVEY